MDKAPSVQVIRNGRVLDVNARTAAEADVLIRGDAVAEVGRPGMDAPADAAVVDAADRLLIPGLVNAHTHGHGSLGKGMGDKWSLELLLNAAPWVSGGFTLEDKYTSALLNAAEMVLKGCTAAYDMYFEFPRPSQEGLSAVGRAYSEIGVRVVLAPMMADTKPQAGRTGQGPEYAAPSRWHLPGDLRGPSLELWKFGRHRGRQRHRPPRSLPPRARPGPEHFGTFKDYCRERWGMGKQYAYRLIEATDVRENLSPIGDFLPGEPHTNISTPLAYRKICAPWRTLTGQFVSHGRHFPRPSLKVSDNLLPIGNKIEVSLPATESQTRVLAL